MTTDAIATVLARLQEGYGAHDATAANYAENCVVESPIAGRHVGPMAVARTFRTLFSAFPDIRLQAHAFIVSCWKEPSGNIILEEKVRLGTGQVLERKLS